MLRAIEIWQIPSDADRGAVPWIFMDWDWAQSNGFSLDDYELVYTQEFDLPENENAALEEVFEAFNLYIPEDYQGRSLSVSDVVAMDDMYYYVDSFGFAPIDQ